MNSNGQQSDDLESTFTSRELRTALSTFSTGVTIVTTLDDLDKPVGMTVSSFNSVSMNPPLILWSVTKSSKSAETFRKAEKFSVHVLASDQVETSNCFASPGIDKFANTEFTTNAHGVPVLSHCSSRFDCSLWACYEGGDHWIIVGHVEGLQTNNTESLVFSGGSYGVVSPLQPAASNIEEKTTDVKVIDGLLIYNLARAYRQVADNFHQSVRESGLSVPQWRILASLHGGAKIELSELAARTFIDPIALVDMVDKMHEGGLCCVNRCATEKSAVTSSEGMTIVGTSNGQQRIEHLLKLSAMQEKKALGDASESDVKSLVGLLQTIITNTN